MFTKEKAYSIKLSAKLAQDDLKKNYKIRKRNLEAKRDDEARKKSKHIVGRIRFD